MCWPSPEPRRNPIAALDPSTYKRHPIHGAERAWAETNCYTDLIVEMLHGLGFEPCAVLPFTLAVDFEGDQWTFFKPPPCDVDALFGLDIQELAIWRPLADHVVEQVEAGRPVLAEVDSFYLPDTAGTAYRLAHTKTTIGVNAIDVERRRLGYWHNAGYFALEGEDFRELFQLDGLPHPRVLPPYVEVAKWRPGFTPPRERELLEASLGLFARHVRRLPRDNPFPRFKARFEQDLDGVLRHPREGGDPLSHFHAYSFANLRQYGACFELAETYLRWLASQGVAGLDASAAALGEISQTAKAFQFQLARSMSRGKALDAVPLDAMAAQWERAMAPLAARFA